MNDIQSNNPDDLFRAYWNQSQVRQQERLSGGSWSQPPWAGWKPIIGAGKRRVFGGAPPPRVMPSGFLFSVNPDGISFNLTKDGISFNSRLPSSRRQSVLQDYEEEFKDRFRIICRELYSSEDELTESANQVFGELSDIFASVYRDGGDREGLPDLSGSGRGVDAFNNMPDRFYQRYAQDGDSGFFHGLRGGSEPLGMNPVPANPFHPAGEISHPTEAYAEPEASVIVPEIVQPSPTPIGLEEEQEIAIHAEPQQRAVYAPPYSLTVKQGMGKIPEDSSLYEEPFKYTGTLHKKKSLRK